MTTLNSILENPDIAGKITVNVGANDLISFANILVEKLKPEPIKLQKSEVYLTPDEAADRLKVTKVTLWNWKKKNILKPVKIGNVTRYKESDIENVLCK